MISHPWQWCWSVPLLKWYSINWLLSLDDIFVAINLGYMMTSSNGNIFSPLLATCAENSPVPGEFLTQRPVTRSFDVFFDLRLNKRLSKQSRGWWLETPSRPLWRHRNVWFENLFYNWPYVGVKLLNLYYTHALSFILRYSIDQLYKRYYSFHALINATT